MRDIIEKAMAQHQLAGNAQITWTVAFVTGEKIAGTLKAFGEGNFALMNAIGPVYFTADKVVYLHPN